MHYREIKAPTLEEANFIIKKEYGLNARIVKTIEGSEGGILGLGKKKFVKVLISITENDFLDNYKKNMGIPTYSQKNEAAAPKKEIPAAKEESLSLSLIMEKINSIEKVIQTQGEKKEEYHPNINDLVRILKENEFSDDLIAKICKELVNQLPVSKIADKRELHHAVYDMIKSRVIIDQKFKPDPESKKVLILVGPTGIGKTTTVTKIAATSITRDKIRVELVTIDGFRIGAHYQLEKYAEIMNVPMKTAEERLALQKIVDLSDANLILVDTIGRSQKDEMNIVKMKQILDLKNCDIQFVLAISAATKPREVEKIFKSFDMFDYDSVIITKLDESDTIGSILSSCIAREKGILFMTNGQRVPNDIERADTFNIMSRIKGLDIEVLLNNSHY